MTSMSRSGQSRTRLDAYGRLTRAGLSISVVKQQLSRGLRHTRESRDHYRGAVFPQTVSEYNVN